MKPPEQNPLFCFQCILRSGTEGVLQVQEKRLAMPNRIVDASQSVRIHTTEENFKPDVVAHDGDANPWETEAERS